MFLCFPVFTFPSGVARPVAHKAGLNGGKLNRAEVGAMQAMNTQIENTPGNSFG